MHKAAHQYIRLSSPLDHAGTTENRSLLKRSTTWRISASWLSSDIPLYKSELSRRRIDFPSSTCESIACVAKAIFDLEADQDQHVILSFKKQ